MEIEKARHLVEACFSDAGLIARYEQADRVSKNQTKHDLPHAIAVRDQAAQIVGWVDEVNPNLLTDMERHVLVPLATFLHDNGRAEDVKTHARLGARWANRFLRSFMPQGEALPDSAIKRIVRAIACHSADTYANAPFSDVVLDITVLADKVIGDEERVRDDRARVLRLLTHVRMSWLARFLREGGEHDRVNFAIKTAKLEREGDRTLVLRLQIDRKVCSPKVIWSVRWNRKAYRCCWLAARKLGFEFQLEFNGVRYTSEGEEADWRQSR